MTAHRRSIIILAALLLGLGAANAFQPRTAAPAPGSRARGRGALKMAAGDAAPANPDHDILLRVARGERAHRTPVWLMRQVCMCVSVNGSGAGGWLCLVVGGWLITSV